MAKNDDLEPDTSNPQTIIVKDEKAALRMKREETKEAQARYNAIVAREKAEKQSAREVRREEIQLEMAKMRMNQSAREKARAHIAVVGPLYLLLLVIMFLALMMTGAVDQDQISVASVLITTIITMIGTNLRSVLSEGEESNGNGHESEPPTKKPDTPKPKDTK